MSFWQLTLTFFLIMDGFGNMPVFMAILKNYPAQRQRAIILREMTFALGIMLIFCFFGKEILAALRVSEVAVKLAGGVVLMFIALQMLFPKNFSFYGPAVFSEPFIVPLATPLTAGPSLIGALLVYGASGFSLPLLFSSLFIAWFFTTLCLYSSYWISKVLGPKMLELLEKIMGYMMALLAVEMFANGVKSLIIH